MTPRNNNADSLAIMNAARVALPAPVRRGVGVLTVAASGVVLGASLFIGRGAWINYHHYRATRLAGGLVALDGSLPTLPSARTGWLWLAAVVVAPLAAAAAFLARRIHVRRAWLVVVLVATIGPMLASLRANLPVRGLATAAVVVSLLAIVALLVLPSPTHRRATATRAISSAVAVVVAAVLAITLLGDVRSTRRAAGSATDAATGMADAARGNDGLAALLLLAPDERPVGMDLAELLQRHGDDLRRLRDALGLDGEAGPIQVQSVETKDDATIVRLTPQGSSASAVIVSVLGGVPIATKSVDGRWYVSLRATKALLPGVG